MKIEDIPIERFEETVLHYYKSDGTFLGDINNEHEFNKLRNKLMRHQLTGECYFIFEGEKILLSKDGNILPRWPHNLYNTGIDDLSETLKLRAEMYNSER